ncbi:hypothetical protein ACQP10_33480 [Streptosporangium sandarakinum]|uniref:hypothetical protein n=1 Tax=Streptosporangium sandarakinum TaxID=1260955 RepID=UPI003D90ED29
MTVIGTVLLTIGFAIGLCLAMADPVLLSRAAAKGREAAMSRKGAGTPPEGATGDTADAGEAAGEIIRLPRTDAGEYRPRAA